MHDADFIFNSLALLFILGLCELESEELAILNALASEDSRETADALLSHDFVILRWVLLSNIGGVLDAASDFTTVLQRLLGLIELTKDNLEERARILTDFGLIEDTHLDFERLGKVDPVPAALGVLLHGALDAHFRFFLVLQHEIMLVDDLDDEITELFEIAVEERLLARFFWNRNSRRNFRFCTHLAGRSTIVYIYYP